MTCARTLKHIAERYCRTLNYIEVSTTRMIKCSETDCRRRSKF